MIAGINDMSAGLGYIANRQTNSTRGREFSGVLDSVSKTVGNALQGEKDCEEGEALLTSWLDVEKGASYGIYRPKDFDSQSPVYKVKMQDANGNATERMIDISKIDPKNCDEQEFSAYCMYQKEKGADFKDTVLKAAVARAVDRANKRQNNTFGSGSLEGGKINWVDVVKEIIHSQQKAGNLQGYLEWQQFLGFLK